MPPCPKPRHKRKVPKLKQRNDFSPDTKLRIAERSGGTCEWCGMALATDYHHVKFRSAGGRGVYTNGLHGCNRCHRMAHIDARTRREMEQKHISMYGEDYYKDEWDVKT